MFTLDRELVRAPERERADPLTPKFAINEHAPLGLPRWKRYVWMNAWPRQRRYAARTSTCGSMVTDVHRILTRGGVFFCTPGTSADPTNRAAAPDVRSQPMGWLAGRTNRRRRHQRQAAVASSGKLHERVSVVLGSKNEVDRVTSYHTGL
jgi:fructose-1,6-bisphosphatase I